MKRNLSLIILFMLVHATYAKHVLPQDAADKAQQYLEWKSGNSLTLKSVKAFDSDASCYIVNFIPSGWVIVSGDDYVMPIIGYNTSGSLTNDNMPDNMKSFIGQITYEIQDAARTNIRRHSQWNHGYNFAQSVTRAETNTIDPLIRVNWTQEEPFNAYCPTSGNTRAIVGCVAVAMAQAMSVQRWPGKPTGNHSYSCPGYGYIAVDYDAERAYNWDDILSGANNKDEVARLLFHTGVSVSMTYGDAESGSGVPSGQAPARITSALKSNFSYPNTVKSYWRSDYNGNWEQLLLNELLAGRAIVYTGTDSRQNGGHAFNLDGYDADGHFHVNWGWLGTGNGFFALSNLSVLGSRFDTNHCAVIGIGAGDQPIKSLALSGNNIEEGLEAGATVAQIFVNGELPKQSHSFKVTGVGGKSVPFAIENGVLKTTNTLNSGTPSYDIEITVYDSELNAKLIQGYTITVTPWQSVEEATSVSFDRESRILTIHTKHNVSYTLTDASGNSVTGGTINPLPQCDITFGEYAPGKYLLKMWCGDDVKQMIIINK